MKKHPESNAKARNWWSYCKHLRKFGKRIANKATRRLIIPPVDGSPSLP